MTAPAVVVLTGYDYEKNLTHFTVTIHEGRNRQVRRMCDAIGFPVRYLRRVMMGTLTLDGLRRGDCRELFHEEIEELRAACGLKRNPEGKAERVVERKPERRAEGKPVRKPEHRTKRRAEEKPEYKGTGRTKRTAGLRANRENAARPNHKKKES
jgi:23S rRNA pseudouridine2605 synthase